MALGPGSIAFVGFNADGTDNLAFVVLEDIAAGTEIKFTTNGWHSDGFYTGEATIIWTAGSAIAAGSVVTLDELATSAPTSNRGTVAYEAGSSFNIGPSNDTIYAYTGDTAAPTAFLAALANDDFSGGGGTLINTGLTLGVTAVEMKLLDNDADIGVYDGRTVALTDFSEFLTLINDYTNWRTQDTGSNDSNDGIAPDVPFSTDPYVVDANANSITFATGSLAVSATEGDGGTTVLTFTVERSGSTAGDVVFSGSVTSKGTTTADDFGGTLPTSFSGVIPDGLASATVTIEVSGDALYEADESFTLTLETAENGTTPAFIADDQITATGTIVNDDVSPVEIAFTGFNSDGAVNLAFVALGDIAAGTVIWFTDNTWYQGNQFLSGESTWSWTATQDVPAGSIVSMDNLASAATATSNFGVITFTEGSGLVLGQDLVYGYLGESNAPTAFLGMFGNNGGPLDDGVIANTGLEWGVNAFNLGGEGTYYDIAAYVGPRLGLDRLEDYRAHLLDRDNWIKQVHDYDQSQDGIAPDVPFSRAGFSTDADPQSIAFAPGSVSVSVAEGDSGTTAITFTVVRTGGTTGALDFSGLFIPGTTDAGDFGGNSPTFSGTIADGETTAQVTITVSGDIAFESNESFAVELLGGTNASSTVVVGETGYATGTIVNDDIPQVVEFAADSLTVTAVEGDSGTVEITFTVERTGGTTGAVDFSGSFAAGATNADDFGGALPTGFSGTIAAGETSTQVTITVSGDVDLEANESFSLTLDSIANADAPVMIGSDSTATGTIEKDEPVPVIAFVGYNGDNADNIAFVTLTDIAAGDQINFTDMSWNGTQFSTAEGLWTWTATADVAAGSVVTMDGLVAGQTATSNLGTIAFADGSVRAIGNYSESVYAFVGTRESPVFLSAISITTFVQYGTLENTGLVEGETAIAFGTKDNDMDIGAYVGPRGATDIDTLLKLINDPNNWITEDTSANDDANGTAPDLPFDTAPFVTGANLQAVGFATESLAVERAEGDSGTTVLTFTVERTGDAVGTLDFSGMITPGATTNAADFGGVAPATFSGSFADGASTATVTVTVAGDVSYESNDSFTLKLLSVSASGEPAYVGPGATATGTILNDDAPTLDIAFVGFTRNGGDNLAFVALSDIAAGTEIQFTDNNWNGSSFATNEAAWTWTATSAIPAGTVVTMDSIASGTATSNLGTIEFADGSSRGLTNYETIYAYTGAPGAPDAFLTAISNVQFLSNYGGLNNTGLIDGITATRLPDSVSIAQYAGPTSGYPTFADYKAAIANPANWQVQDYGTGTENDGTDPDVPYDVPAFTVDPGAQLVQFEVGSLSVSVAEGDAGTTELTFTVVRSGSTTGDLSFSGSIVPGSFSPYGSNGDGGTLQGSDFAGGVLPTSFSGTIAAGETSATVTVTIAGDAALEMDERFTLTIDEASNASATVIVGGQSTAVGTIEDDDAQTIDIAFVGINAEGDDALAFLALSDIAAGTVIQFSDKTWNVDSFESDSGSSWSWTATSDIAAGTVVTLDTLNGDTPTSNLGTIARTGSGDMVYVDYDNQPVVYAYFGEVDKPTAFLSAVTTGSSFPQIQISDGSYADVLYGTGLTQGVDAVAGGSNGPVAVFDGPRAGYADWDAVRAALNGGWGAGDQEGYGEDHIPSHDGIFPDVPLSTLPFVVGDDVQVVGFADEPIQAKPEYDDGQATVYTFTVVRTGGTTGAIEFSGVVLTGIYAEGHQVTPEDFGGTIPTFSGTIAEGETSTTVTVTVSGDTVYETDETFTVELTEIANTAGAAVGAGDYRATGIILDFDEAPSQVGEGEVITNTISVGGDDHLVIAEDGVLSVADGNAISWDYAGTPVVDNYGTIRADNPLGGGIDGTLTINNFDGALIVGDWSPSGRLPEGSTIVVNNAGTIENDDRVLDFHDVVKGGGYAIVNNLAGGVIQTTNSDTDMIRPGARTVINNAGTIKMLGDGGGDGIDYQDNNGGVVNNLAGGWIEGARHAITGDDDITVTNAAGGTIIGRNGSAVNMDTSGSEIVSITNHGRMEGRSENLDDSDGDAVDVDGILALENYGFIGGMGHNGYHDGEPNVSEGLAIGGGTINNYVGGEIYGYGRAIQVDNSSNSTALGAANIVNAGMIRGDGNLPTGVAPEDVELFAERIRGGEAINILGDFGDSLINEATGEIIGGVKMGGGDDTLVNSGTMTATGGGAVDMGDGDDTLTLHAGSTITGLIDGGEGDDTIVLAGAGMGTLGVNQNFERLDLQGGVWSIASAAYADVRIANGGTSISEIALADGGGMTVVAGGSIITTGDAVTSNGAASVDNYGTIAGLGAAGRAVLLNGGMVTNHAGAVMIGMGAVVESSDGAGGDASEAMTVVNAGVMQSLGGQALSFVGAQDDNVTNNGVIIGGVDLGGGDDTLTIKAGSTISGAVEGGEGADTVKLTGAATSVGILGATSGFETLVVEAGTWSVTDNAETFTEIVVEDGATLTSKVSLRDADTLLIEEGGALTDTVTIRNTATGIVLDNYGTIAKTTYGQAVTVYAQEVDSTLTIWNREGAVISSSDVGSSGVFSVDYGEGLANVVINNAGLIETLGEGRVLTAKDFDGASLTLNNLATGVIRSGGAEATVYDNFTTVNNAGRIEGGEEGFDFKNNIGVTFSNLSGGYIEGAHHAVTGERGVTVLNEAGAAMIGHNGSAVNIDNNGSEEQRVYVTNYGTMEGRSAETEDSDGDAIDVDGLLTLDNYGTILGLGAEGYHNGEPNVSEGLAIGGGTINNHEGGTIFGYGRAIQVDNSSNSAALGVTTIVNAGTIEGEGHGPEGVDPEDAAGFDLRGNEAVNLLGDYADSLANTGTIIGGVSMGGGDDLLTNAGTMTATGGSAIDMGEGADVVILVGDAVVTGTILLGHGNDVLTAAINAVTVGAGAGLDSVIGSAGDDTIDGGADNDFIRGSAGDDVLIGGDGSDVFSYAAGDGDDTIVEGAGLVGDIDQLVFTDIVAGEATLYRLGDDLQVVTAGGVITVTDQFAGGGLESILFGDGSVLNAAGIGSAIENRAPDVGEPVTLATVEEDAASFIVSFADLLANASDADLDTLIVSEIGETVGGTATIVAGGVEFTLDPNFNGTASFTYTVADGKGGIVGTSASFDVTPVNDLPVTVADAASAGENETAMFDLVANDTDAEDGSPTLAGFTVTSVDGIALSPEQASAAFSIEAGKLKFEPGTLFDALGADDTATVTIEYAAADGDGAETAGSFVLTVNGASDVNVIDGSDGDDFVIGTSGDDEVTAGDGSDVIIGGYGNDTINGGDGNDIVFGGSGDSFLNGGLGNDFLVGGSGSETLDGGMGNDTLMGGMGNDIIIGGEGNDLLFGDGGSDTFVFGAGDGHDTAFDFKASGAGHDVIELDADHFADFDTLIASGSLTDTVLGARITEADGSTLTIANIGVAQLTEANFLFV